MLQRHTSPSDRQNNSSFPHIVYRFTQPVRLAVLPLLFIIIVYHSLSAKSSSFVGIQRFTIDPSASEYYNSLDILLFQRLNFELLPRGIKPLLVGDTMAKNCIVYVRGTIDMQADEPVLLISLAGMDGNEEETKKINLKDQTPDALIDILAIKVRHFLEQNISGKLRISSVPLDCDLLLDGIKIGKTPAELVLEQGDYRIEIQREYLKNYMDSITIQPGQEIALTPTLAFQGRSVNPWIASAALFTSLVFIAQVVEIRLHDEYSDLPRDASEQFTPRYNAYRIANAVKIGLLIPMAATWSITGYQILENRSLKRRIFE